MFSCTMIGCFDLLWLLPAKSSESTNRQTCVVLKYSLVCVLVLIPQTAMHGLITNSDETHHFSAMKNCTTSFCANLGH